VPNGPTTARRESSSSVDKPPAPSSAPNVSTLSVSVVETLNFVPSVLSRVTLPGLQNPPLARRGSLASYVYHPFYPPDSPLYSLFCRFTMLPTTNLSERIPLSRAPLSKSMLLPSASGTNLMQVRIQKHPMSISDLPCSTPNLLPKRVRLLYWPKMLQHP